MQNKEEELIQRLNQLTTEKTKIETRLSEINENKKSKEEEIQDRDRKTINIGDTVLFLTKGKYHLTRGIVTRINNFKITAKDKKGNNISGAPHNIQHINQGKNTSHHE